ncbi:hypothetical protein GZL_01803 [Streptomyces sp. 769]|nr:hypothetical protein GZL_01803 [Streptomyces sp. 769]
MAGALTGPDAAGPDRPPGPGRPVAVGRVILPPHDLV